MAIESHFYDTIPGQGINEVEWAESARSRGTVYGVASASDLLCTAHPSTPYAVNISPGPNGFWGHGVWDTSDSIVTVTFTPPANGTRRFDLVTGRRDWTPTGGGPTTIAKVQGTSARAIPAGRESSPGEVDDQPLWLVEWLGGQTQPQSITDLRLIGGRYAKDLLAFRFLKIPGMDIHFEGKRWEYLPVDSNGNWDWVNSTVHLEIATTQANQAGVAYGPGLAAKMQSGIDVARSSNQGRFAIGPADRITIRESGLYAVSWLLYGLAGASGAIGIHAGTANAPKHASDGFTGAGEASLSIPNVWLNAGDVLGFYFIANRTVNAGHRIRVSKIG